MKSKRKIIKRTNAIPDVVGGEVLPMKNPYYEFKNRCMALINSWSRLDFYLRSQWERYAEKKPYPDVEVGLIYISLAYRVFKYYLDNSGGEENTNREEQYPEKFRRNYNQAIRLKGFEDPSLTKCINLLFSRRNEIMAKKTIPTKKSVVKKTVVKKEVTKKTAAPKEAKGPNKNSKRYIIAELLMERKYNDREIAITMCKKKGIDIEDARKDLSTVRNVRDFINEANPSMAKLGFDKPKVAIEKIDDPTAKAKKKVAKAEPKAEAKKTVKKKLKVKKK